MDNNSIELVCAKRRPVTLDMMEKIECGAYHNLGIYDGKVYSWGSNEYGQLGDGSTTDRKVPVAVNTNGVLYGKTITDISCGFYHSMCLDSDGVVYTWGKNDYGQLGNNDYPNNQNVPVAVNTNGVLSGKTIVDISAGGYHSKCLDSNGVVYGWGYNYYGELGDGTTTSPRNVPVAVDVSGVLSGKTITKIMSGYNHSLALDSNGVVYSWGRNNNGQLGNNDFPNNQNVPVAVYTNGVLSGKTIVDISAGYSHSLALDSDGVVYSWGNNYYGQLGDGTTTRRTTPVAVKTSGVLSGKTIVDISCGNIHTLCLDSNGVMYSWGYNYYGQLGDGSKTNRTSPVAVDVSGVLSGKTIVDISAGYSHTLCLDSNGVMYSWGWNNHGQLGDGSTTDSTYPITVIDSYHIFEKIVSGYSHCLGLYKGEVWGWGRNNYGQLGNDTTTDIYTPVKMLQEEGLLLGKTIVDISAGNHHSLLLDSDGKMYSCGLNTSGQCGDGTTTSPRRKPVAVDTSGVLSGKKIVQISCGANHTLCLDSDGVVYSWGDNGYSQLGDGNYPTDSYVPVAVDVSGVLNGKTITYINGGAYTSFCIADGQVYGWGRNNYGQLGNDDYPNDSGVPVAVVQDSGLLLGKTIVKVCSGVTQSVCLTSDNNIYGWGSGGRTGDNTSTRRDKPVAVYTAGDLSGKTVVDISVGGYNSMCLDSDGGLYAWGAQNYYSLGTGELVAKSAPTKIMDGIPVAKMFQSKYRTNGCFDTEGNAYFWGIEEYGIYGKGNLINYILPTIGATMIPTIEMMEKVCYGHTHSLGIYNGEVWAWGRNTYGQLGNNDATGAIQTRPVKVLQESGVLLGKRVTDISTCDDSSACIAQGVVYTWGRNNFGQLGNGDATLATQIKPVAVDVSGVLAGKTLVKLGGCTHGHVTALDSNGKVYCWGKNQYGNCGDASSGTDRISPVAVDTSGVLSGKTITKIMSGYNHNLVIDSNGVAYGWGQGSNGRLGNGTTTTNITSPVAVDTSGVLSGKTIVEVSCGGAHSHCIDSDGVLYAFGYNIYGQLGDGSTTQRTTPVAVDTSGALNGKTIVKVSQGYYSCYCLDSDGKVYVCGRNNFGQFGNGSTSDTPQDEFILWNSTGELEAKIGEYTVVDISKNGLYGTAVILSDGTMYASGYNNYGQLGVGTTTSPQTLPVKTKKTYRYYH